MKKKNINEFLNKIVCCDVLEGLKSLPDQSVQCVVTSPPYWGLRNYKTGTWEGGDPNCDHLKPPDTVSHKTSTLRLPKKRLEAKTNVGHAHQSYQNECKKCGAKRIDKQIGLEKTPDEYVENLVKIFNEVWRVLRDDGVVWLNLGDTFSSYKDQSVRHQTVAGHSRDEPAMGLASNRNGKVLASCGLKHKELVGIPWRVGFALQRAGWYLRSDIIWAKSISFCSTYVGSCMPESCKDRPTRSHEYVFLLTKQPHYFFDNEAIKEEGVYPQGTKAAKGSGTREGNRRDASYAVYNGKRNVRSVWAIQTKPYNEAHFATFPEKLIEPMIKAGTSEKGCCSKCRAPYKRTVKRTRLTRPELPKDHPHHRPNIYKGDYADINGKGDAGFTNVETIGWERTCECKDSKTVPCIVLDFFMGAGTTAVVAKRLERDFIGFDLNSDYCKIAEKRLTEQPKIERKKKIKLENNQLSLKI
jgi:DNA modification methylase